VKFNISGATKDLQRKVKAALDETALKLEMGSFLTERVAFKARSGKPLNDTGNFPPLKDSSKAIRRRDNRRKHPAFSPERSNLTITGQLIDAVSFRQLRDTAFELFVDDTQRFELGAPNNKQVADDLASRDFVIFTANGLKRDKNIPRRLKEILLRFLRRQLKS
jgi:hypothetical protein